MQRLVLFTLTMGLLAAAVPKAGSSATDPEIDAIRAVADAYISADPVRLRDAFLPSMNLYTTDEKEALRTIPFAEIQVRKIQYILAAGPYTEIFIDDGSKWIMLRSIKQWRARLPQAQFAAIHRSTIVNLDFVDRLEPLPNYSYRIVLRGSKCQLLMSRRRALLLKERMA